MWGELIDAGDIEQMVWPRAAAAAGNFNLDQIELLTLFLKNGSNRFNTGENYAHVDKNVR